jgi:hypothetical protein
MYVNNHIKWFRNAVMVGNHHDKIVMLKVQNFKLKSYSMSQSKMFTNVFNVKTFNLNSEDVFLVVCNPSINEL